MARYLLHRVDGRVIGPLASGEVARLCSEGRAFDDEAIADVALPARAKQLAQVPTLASALEAGRLARAARVPQSVPVVAGDLRRAVVQVRTPTGSGTGFAIDESGLVLTNLHVVDDSSTCTAHFGNGAVSPGAVVFRSEHADLAVIRVALPTPDFVCLAQRRGDAAAVGEQVVALGFPLDAGFNVTQGIISALGVTFSASSGHSPEFCRHGWVRTSTEINGGNSGGPVVDLHGCVVGVATWGQNYDSAGRPVAGFNYCIPHAVVCRELREFRRLTGEAKLRIPPPEEIQRQSQQPDPLDELDLAVGLLCSRHRMRVTKKVPIPELSRGFRQAHLVSAAGDAVHFFVDHVYDPKGPPYLTIYGKIGEVPGALLGDAAALGELLRSNSRIPHWNLALTKDNILVLRFSRQLDLLNAPEVLVAVEDLLQFLNRLMSDGEE